MGYTHYWNVKDPAVIVEKFDAFREGANQIIGTALDAGIELENLVEKDNIIAFDGGVETFFFAKDGTGFNFCKTGQLPYDTVVTGLLILAKKIFGSAISVSSDGNWAEWSGGRLLYETVYDIEPRESEVFGNVVD